MGLIRYREKINIELNVYPPEKTTFSTLFTPPHFQSGDQ